MPKWWLGVVAEHFRYTEWRSRKKGDVVARELYDHRTDPLENRNLAGKPEAAEATETLAEQLDRRLAQ